MSPAASSGCTCFPPPARSEDAAGAPTALAMGLSINMHAPMGDKNGGDGDADDGDADDGLFRQR